MAKIGVLVVDDSAFMRRVISDIINQSTDLQVIGLARNGSEALTRIKELQPDVVTMDIEMPVMDGLTALDQIMKANPVPVVMLSSLTKEGAEQTLKALQRGAVDFLAKPSGQISLDIETVAAEIVEKVRIAAGTRKQVQNLNYIVPVDIPKPAPLVPVTVDLNQSLNNLVLIGTSTGGPKALYQVIPRLPARLNAGVLVVQHMPAGFTRSLAERLDTMSAMKVKEAEQGEKIIPGTVYIAPGDYHLKVNTISNSNRRELHVKLDQSPPRGTLRPAVDAMLESVAQEFWSHMVCVIMTGMGHDGAGALPLLKQKGARIIAEDQSTCIVYGMPKAAVETGLVDKIIPLFRIADEITRMV